MSFNKALIKTKKQVSKKIKNATYHALKAKTKNAIIENITTRLVSLPVKAGLVALTNKIKIQDIHVYPTKFGAIEKCNVKL